MDPQDREVATPPGVLERALHLFADVRRGEGWTAILLTLNVFLLLTAYYLLKVSREPLILAIGAETKSYAAAGQALPLFGRPRPRPHPGRNRPRAERVGASAIVVAVLGRGSKARLRRAAR